MSQLNVDTIGGQTGTTISLVSGHTLSGTSIKEVDQWALTAALTSDAIISSNLSRLSTEILAGEALGTGMSVSSGYWTFPSTGYWLVRVQASWRSASNDGCSLKIYGTNDNSTYNQIGQTGFGKSNDGSNIDSTTFAEIFLKITDTSNDKIRFNTDSIGSGSELRGSSSYVFTGFLFMKVGEV